MTRNQRGPGLLISRNIRAARTSPHHHLKGWNGYRVNGKMPRPRPPVKCPAAGSRQVPGSRPECAESEPETSQKRAENKPISVIRRAGFPARAGTRPVNLPKKRAAPRVIHPWNRSKVCFDSVPEAPLSVTRRRLPVLQTAGRPVLHAGVCRFCKRQESPCYIPASAGSASGRKARVTRRKRPSSYPRPSRKPRTGAPSFTLYPRRAAYSCRT